VDGRSGEVMNIGIRQGAMEMIKGSTLIQPAFRQKDIRGDEELVARCAFIASTEFANRMIV